MIRIMKEAQVTNLGFALIGLLHQGPMSGYDLRKVFAETALGSYSSSPGAIYPALRRLEEQGLVEGENDHTRKLRPKRLYRPTPAGTARICNWLGQSIEPSDVASHFDELMLRFAFHGILESNPATHRFLSELAEALDRHVKELRTQRKLFPAEAPVQSRLALEAGIEQYRAAYRWARKAREQFA